MEKKEGLKREKEGDQMSDQDAELWAMQSRRMAIISGLFMLRATSIAVTPVTDFIL